MRRGRPFTGLLWLLLLLSPVGQGSIAIDGLEQPMSIAGPWQFKAGDEAAWAMPDLDDGDWLTADVPVAAPEGYTDYAGIAWYRVTLRLNLQAASVRKQVGSLAVSMGAVNSAYELYAGGQLLGGVGALPPDSRIVYDQHQVYQIPPAAIDEEGRLVLALRVWRPPRGAWNLGPYDGPFQLGNVGDLRYDALFQAMVPNIILAALYLAVGLYHLLIARRNPVMREFFWFGWLGVALAAYSFETSQLKFMVDIPYLIHKKIEYFSLYIGPFLLTEVLVRVVGVRLNLAGRLFQHLFLVYALVVLVIPNHDIHHLTLRSFQFLAAAWCVGTVLVMARYAWQGSRRARGILLLMLVFTAVVFNDVIAQDPLLASTYLLHLMFAMIILFMAVVMANNYTATLAKLEQSVEERTADLQQSNRELEKAVAVRSQFLANMSHELRTPMNAIIGLTHLGLKTELTEQQRGYLTTVEQSAQALSGIIESIFDFSKLETGELECDKQVFSPAKVVANLAAVYGSQAEAKGLGMTFEQDPAIPAHLIGDPLRIGQVLAHLVSNAIKFTEQGEVRFSARLLERSDEQVTLEFAVSDTGPGISSEQLDQLFESFSQADSTNTRVHGGTGLGLAISRALAELMGGALAVQSTPGAGSTFSLTLPLEIASEVPGADDDEVAGEVEQELDLTPIQGAQVLLVDDSAINLQVAGELLGQARLYVDKAQDGQEAVDRAADKQYDCILMDIQMPVMDGYTATREIRTLAGYANVPILALTANVLPEDRAKAERAGLNDHIPKPIDPQELFRKLVQWIEPGERVPFEASPAAPAEAAELPPRLPGIAIAEGMKRVGGNSRLYLKLLRDLRTDYADAADTIERLFQAGDITAAAQLAHKLRGIANNLGASEVGAGAEQIELGLKADEAVTDEAFAVLAQRITTVIDSINELEQLAAGGSDSKRLSEQEVAALLGQLEQEIADNNPTAEETVEQLLQGIDDAAPVHPTLAAVRDAIDIYDFPSAGEHLAEARQLACK